MAAFPPDGLKFGTGAAGKPYLVGQSKLQFNMHTLGASLRAFASGPTGVDVEALDLEREINSVSEENYAPTEATDLEACEKGRRRQARFIELMDVQGGLSQSVGRGLVRPLHEIAFRFAGPSGIHATEGGSLLVDWRFGLFAAQDSYRLAVAVHTNTSLRFLRARVAGKRGPRRSCSNTVAGGTFSLPLVQTHGSGGIKRDHRS